MSSNDNTPPGGWAERVASIIKGLTFTNVLMLFLLSLIVVPGYIMYRAVNDPTILERMLSSYKEFPPQDSGCTLREFKARGGPRMWTISTGFAYQGTDKWVASIVLDHMPNEDENVSYCESLKLVTESWRNISETAP